MSRAKQRSSGGHRPAPLFDFTSSPEYVTAGDVPDNPRLYPCGHCGATVNADCTRPTRRGRAPLPKGRYHPGRGRPATAPTNGA